MPISKRTETLLAIVPTDADRDAALALMHKRERQYRDVCERAAEIAARCAEIAEALPDAAAKERSALQAERRDLLAEAAGLPTDRRVLARLYAEALSEWSAAVHAVIQAERTAVARRLERTQPALNEAQYRMNQLSPGDPRHPALYDAYRAIVAQRQPDTDRSGDLRELAALVTAYVQDALRAGASSTGHEKVKITNGRPIAAHVAGFIAAQGKAA